MTTTYEPKNKELLNKCLKILSKPIRAIKDSHSAGYFENRKRVDAKEEVRLLNSQIDDANYYNELLDSL